MCNHDHGYLHAVTPSPQHHEDNEKAGIQGAPAVFFLLIFILTKPYRSTTCGKEGHAPFSSRCPHFYMTGRGGRPSRRFHSSHFDTMRRGTPPLHVVSFPFWHGEEGYAPSPLCSSHFDVTRRGLAPPRRIVSFLTQRGGVRVPLPIMFFPFRRDEEGAYPSSPCCFPFDTAKRGKPPSPLCCFHFNVTRRQAPSLLCCFHFNAMKRGLPLPAVLFPFQCDEEGACPSLSCSSYFDTTRRVLAPPCCVVSLSTWRGGEYLPSSSCCSYFDVMGRCTPPPRVVPVYSHFNRVRRGMPPICLFSIEI